MLGAAFAIIGAIRLYRNGMSAEDVKAAVQKAGLAGLAKLAQVWAMLKLRASS